jgi:hypothetical protein
MSGITLLNTNINPGQIQATGTTINVEYVKDDATQTYNAFTFVDGGVKNSAGNLTYYVSSGSLTADSGFATSTLNPNTGVITRLSFTGGSSSPQIANYTVSVKDANGRIATNFTTVKFTTYETRSYSEYRPTDTYFEVANPVTPWVPFVATGGKPPYTYGIYSGSLPAGLSYSTSGAISGTPTTADPNPPSVVFKATDSLGVVISSYASYPYNYLLVIQPRLTSTANTSTLYFMQNRGLSNTAYAIGANTHPFTSITPGVLIADKPYQYSSSINFSPYGFSFAANGAFIGKPTTVSTGGITSTFSVKDSLNVSSTITSTKKIIIAPEITAVNAGTGVSGVTVYPAGVLVTGSGIYMLQASGGVTNYPGTALKANTGYVYYVVSGALPSNMTIQTVNNGGYLQGTPIFPGTYTFTLGVFEYQQYSDKQRDPLIGLSGNQNATYQRTFVMKVA